MNVVYIGNRFYSESSTMMSSVYEMKIVDGGREYTRTDWGFINVALERGEAVNIRPVLQEEIRYFEKMLEERKRKMVKLCQ